jgi:hypothetical protein
MSYLKVYECEGAPSKIPSGCALAWDKTNDVFYENGADGNPAIKYFKPEATTGTAAADSQFGTGDALTYEKVGDIVHIHGELTFGTPSGTGVTASALGATLRPDAAINIPAVVNDDSGSTLHPAVVTIGTDGTVTYAATGLTVATDDVLYVNGSYYVDP